MLTCRSGLHPREALSKDRKKDSSGGEDAWLLKPASAWGLEGQPGAALVLPWLGWLAGCAEAKDGCAAAEAAEGGCGARAPL